RACGADWGAGIRERAAAPERDDWIEGPHARRVTGDGERHGEDGPHAALAGMRICLLRPVNRVLGAWRSLLRPADRRSRDRTVPAASETSAGRSIRPDPAAEPSAP